MRFFGERGLKPWIFSTRTLQITFIWVQHPENSVWGSRTDHSGPKNTVLGQKWAFLAIFGQKMRFIGDGGSKTIDKLLHNLAENVFVSPAVSKYGGGPHVRPFRPHKHCFRPKNRIFLPIFG